MNKAARKAFEKQLAAFNAEALQVFGIAQDLLAKDGIPASHHGHQAEIVGELVRNSSSLVSEAGTLLGLGDAAGARKRVRDGLTMLKALDPALFMPAPSPRLAAYMLVGNPGGDAWMSAIGSMTYATEDKRRRVVLPLRRALLAQGAELPNEDDVTSLALLDRNEAMAAQMRAGGGVRASQQS